MDSRKAGITIVAAGILITLIAVIIAVNGMPDGKGTTTSTGSDKIAVIHLNGTIAFSQSTSLLDASGTSATMNDLERAEQDPSLQAVVLRINSPGGSAAASHELYSQVMRVKESGKIVVASFGETAASGGYYVGAAADKIVALPSTLTGSIGVISTVPNLEELYKMIGYEEYVFKSGPHKDMLSASRPITAEEEEIMQDITDDIYDQFLDAVVEGRGLTKEEVRQLADGRVYSGNQAKEVGLVDELGGQREAIELAAQLGGIEGEPEIVEYSRTPGVFDILRNVQLFTPNPFDSLPTYTTIKY